MSSGIIYYIDDVFKVFRMPMSNTITDIIIIIITTTYFHGNHR